MPKPILYSLDMSPPCRAVLMAAEAVGVNLDVRNIDLEKKEHLTDEFLKMNPEHTIPTLNDNGFILWDSQAINCYLVNKYSKDLSLYPKDPQKRAMVDQRLHFNNGVIFPIAKTTFPKILFFGETSVPAEKLVEIQKVYNILEKLLEGRQWLAGDSYTLADINCCATISTLACIKTLEHHPNLDAWLKRCEEHLPGYQKYNQPGINDLRAALRTKLA
ncbi:hypothetical protein KM043_005842 [Ampulex compressa]|nr:hypothetical protein KM043_005842 [Ampulex compressa]